MPLDSTTVRPAGTGGIDLSGIDVEAAIFTATGGGYGNPSGTATAEGGTPAKLSDWVTNFGDGTLVDAFDFDQPLPGDRDAPIKLLAEPEGSHPLIDLIAPKEEPDFANGGPEGTGWAAVAAAVVIVVVLWGIDDVSNGAICNILGWQHGDKPKENTGSEIPKWEDTHYSDPDAVTGTLQSPAEMMAGLLGKAGVTGVDPTSVEITDLLGKLTDQMGKVSALVGSLLGAAQSGDSGAFDSALSDLMQLAGLDASGFDLAKTSPQDLMDGVFAAFGISGGLEGGSYLDAMQDPTHVWQIAELSTEQRLWVTLWDDGIA